MQTQSTDHYHYYCEQEKILTQQYHTLRSYNRIYILAELLLFVLAIGCVVLYTLYSQPWLTLFPALLLLMGYGVVRHFDVRNTARYETLQQLIAVYRQERQYLEGNFATLHNGENYIDPHHAFTLDLDIFGNASLFQRINRTVTLAGRNKLAYLMQCQASDHEPLPQYAAETFAAVSELAALEPWRVQWMTLDKGKQGILNTQRILDALESVKHFSLPFFLSSSFLPYLATISSMGCCCSILAACFSWVSYQLPLWWAVIHIFAVLFACSASLKMLTNTIDALLPEARGYVSMLRMIEQTTFHTQRLAELQNRLKDALPAFVQLERLSNACDRRGNILGTLLFNALFLNDFFLLLKFSSWKKQYLEAIPRWLDVLASCDALVSMATFAYNHPDTTKPIFVNRSGVYVEAQALRHPFLGSKAVPNDFELTHQHYHIITGANMAGKSTFLRSVGINIVLAMMGMPVFASRFSLSVFHLFTGMRTSDDLSKGISYFNAELLRLQQLLVACRQQSCSLIILDEILKGTNSADKLNGSRLFLEAVSTLPVSGLIATHDLELSKMETTHAPLFTNLCFEIEIGTNVTYTYKIRPGVAQNQNATFLLREILKSV